ncbi:MAG: hypothetical protein DME03_10400 [Candidatus Rokuibacteriota bacterium]|nr:MAG: hypothetical protein DME03_10400 [Candidatus Rokubacteria bacterium]
MPPRAPTSPRWSSPSTRKRRSPTTTTSIRRSSSGARPPRGSSPGSSTSRFRTAPASSSAAAAPVSSATSSGSRGAARWPAFRPGSFDIVISNGVLHHTGDPRGGFESILRCLKPGGFIVIGLYNTYGRLTTDFRRLVFRLTGDRLTFLDPRLRRVALNEARRRAWFMDQYKHPHESKHTYDEVLRWFDESGVEFVKSIPKCVATERFSPTEELFVASSRGTAADRLLVQLFMLLSGGREGGFFTMIGRKKA